MDEFGHILREARETKGLTIKDVQQEIRINVAYIDALEQGEYDTLPSPVHARGFLRNYAHFLGLDPQPLLDQYERQLDGHAPPTAVLDSSEKTRPTTIIPSRKDQPFFDPVNYRVNDGRGSPREKGTMMRVVVIIALMIAIGLVASRFIPSLQQEEDPGSAITDGITDVLTNLQDEAINAVSGEADADPLATPASTPIFGEEIVSTSRNNVDNELPAIAPTRPPLPATMETVRLKLEVLERAWMEVTIDGDVVFTGFAKEGDPPYEWEAQEEAIVNTGNAIGLYATVNDVPLGRLGGRGEQVEETWRTTN
jgi:cytoskeletal protein RodZ